jgi:hypothetical protein
VTDPEATRYLLIREAAQLVLQAGTIAEGGEVLFLEMGKPVRIMDLAQNFIRMHGLEPSRDIPIEFVGLREGERLNEQLLMEQEELVPSEHEQVHIVQTRHFDAEAFRGLVPPAVFGQVRTGPGDWRGSPLVQLLTWATSSQTPASWRAHTSGNGLPRMLSRLTRAARRRRSRWNPY